VAIWEVEADEAVYTVEGEDWMQVAIEVLRRVAPAAARCPSLSCEVLAVGGVAVRELHSGVSLLLSPRNGPADWIRSRLASTEHPILLNEDRPYVFVGGPPLEAVVGITGTAPPPGAAERAAVAEVLAVINPACPPADLDARLGDAIERLVGAQTQEEAGQRALQILREFVPAESGAVITGGPKDDLLRFLALRGPRAEALRRRGLKLPRTQGIAGFVFSTGASLMLRDVGEDTRHHRAADQASGYRTRAVLAVPVQVSDGLPRWGVLELLNAPGGFHSWHVECASVVASVLAEVLSELPEAESAALHA
jgi:hypothetical protein